ncbi:ATP-binding protein [Allonocardiopsis opalescens]|uniref:Anti-sigma regulatory factor (Ser/Thr protein kinase) n=1 Tax=Allonocardiopsis opalescens TaxID=1144618 RepID=A0A2T0PZ76_9ACTN|nr:ATP-binding protein [Allonocardiopsis opalescens]PRX96843.1 anti-sigma regulatory factor (Ser/Thr protein kinase) [Allonocardiopsis opalescens]
MSNLALRNSDRLRHEADAAATFRGTIAAVPDARRWTRRMLAHAGVPADVADTALLLVSELAANAVRHTRSGEPGGRFRLRVRCAAGAVRVECDDQGGRDGARPRYTMSAPDAVGGRGLALVARLSAAYGHRTAPSGGTAHVELRWPAPSRT